MDFNTTRTERLRRELRDLTLDGLAICDEANEKTGGVLTAEQQGRVDRILSQAKSLKARIKAEESDDQLRQQIAELGAGMETKAAPMGARAGVWSKAFFEKIDRLGGLKELVPSGSVTVPGLRSTLTTLGGQPNTVLSLIPMVPLEGTDSFAYLRETVRTHAAATVPAGAVKPTSTYSVEKVEDKARVIAHLSEPVPKTTLNDVPLLRAYLDGALREGLALALEYQVFNGSGVTDATHDEFEGLLAISGVLSQAFDTDMLTATRKAITALQLANITPDGWAMHPNDWEAFELLQDLTGRYYLGATNGGNAVPVDRANRRLWGLPVALSTAVAEGTAWLGDWRGSLELKEREATRIDWSENVVEGGVSDFTKNQIRFRAEGRWGLAALRPGGMVQVYLTAGS